MNINSKKVITSLVVVLIIGVIWYLESQKPDMISGNGNAEIESEFISETAQQKLDKYERAKEIVNPSGFLNTEEPVNIEDMIGEKVILVDFWTYSCINCQRTTPYLNAWYEKYHDKGLEIIGIHTPEFEFEKERENVAAAIEKFGIKYPVVQDNDYSTWRAYGNRYWPRKYLIDIDGFIVYDHIGEGAYEETEKKIQQLLAERREVLGEDVSIDQSVTNPEGAESVDSSKPRTPEIYFGASRNKLLANGASGKVGIQDFSAPENLAKNLFYLDGSWNIQKEYAENTSQTASIFLRYQGKNVFMVASSGKGVTAQIYIDGELVSGNAGRDVNPDGEVFIQNEALYRLVEDQEYGEHILEIRLNQPGLRAFTFTFG